VGLLLSERVKRGKETMKEVSRLSVLSSRVLPKDFVKRRRKGLEEED